MTTLIPKYDLKNGGSTPAGAVNRLINEKLAETISVKDFGAIGNGTTDDTASINAAIAFAISTGGNSVYFPAGNYKVTSTITWTGNGVQLIGEGRGISKITANFATGDIIYINGSASSGVKQLSITSSVAKTTGAAIHFANCHNVQATNIGLESNMYYGIQIEGGAAQFITTIDDFEIDSGVIGILIGGSTVAADTWIQNGVINACTNAGIFVQYASGLYLYGVDIISCSTGITTYPSSNQSVSAVFADAVLCDTCGTNGWNFITNGGNVNEVTLVNCWGSTCGAVDHTSSGMYFGQGSGKIEAIAITNPICVNNQGQGIFVQGATKINIVNPIVSFNSMNNSNADSGITFYQNSSNFSVIGGMCGYDGIAPVNYQQHGIFVDNSCTNFSIIGVDVTGNLSSGILNNSPTAGHVYGNTGYATNTSGTTSIPVGASTIVVTHGLASTPVINDLSAVPNNDLAIGGAARYWVWNVTSTTFNISVNTTVSGTAIPFSWQARTSGA